LKEGREKEASANIDEPSKNVTNLKPERFSRRAKHKQRQTPCKHTAQQTLLGFQGG